jgi:cysteine desulfurase/selenocysteine lyase
MEPDRRYKERIAVLILAAGGSSRMGEQKLLCTLGDETIVRISVETAFKSGVGPVTVVVGSDADKVSEALDGLPVSIAYNEHWHEGQASSINIGVQALKEFEAIIVMVADQPFISADSIRRLVDLYELEHPPLAVSSVAGTRGSPALFASCVFNELLTLQGDQGARQLFIAYAPREVEQDEPDLFLDVDDKASLAHAREQWSLRLGARNSFPLLRAASTGKMPPKAIQRPLQNNPARFVAPIASAAQPLPLAYLDNAATTQVPERVLRAQQEFECTARANIHRGIYPLAETASERYEDARKTVATFFGAHPNGTVFTHGTTEGMNLVAFGWGSYNLRENDLVLIDTAAHHAALVPWQMLAQQVGIRLAFIPVDHGGSLIYDAWYSLLEERPKAVILTHVSNVTGFACDLAALTKQAQAMGAAVIADCAQSAGHMPLDIGAAGVDFAAASSHKMYGPFGSGALCVAENRIEEVRPLFGGGGMIERVSIEGFTVRAAPAGLEAGTPNITGAIGFAAACDFVNAVGPARIEQHTSALSSYAVELLSDIEGVQLIGRKNTLRTSIVSFNLGGIHPHDVADSLAEQGIAVRAGHHCAMPLHEALGIKASVRASFAVYSTKEEVARLAEALEWTRGEYSYA